MATNAREFGTIVDHKKGRYQCTYCGKVVSGLKRLKCHLGGVRGDVAPCLQVPEDVKAMLRNELQERRFGNAMRDVGELDEPNLPLKRKREYSPAKLDKQDSSDQNSGNVIDSVFPRGQVDSPAEGSGVSDSSLRKAQKSIGRFFYETGVDFDAIKSPSFVRMIKSIIGPFNTMKIPTCNDLKGWILQDAVKEMQEYTSDIKSVWAATGCSILLDGWVDSRGRKLVNILVYCPKGTVYRQSYDISAIDGNAVAMEDFLDSVIEEVGVDNVVQIVSYSTSTFMEDVGKRVNQKHKRIFWTVSASHCIELMLNKLAMMDAIKEILEKAKTITQFVYSNEDVLKLARKFCSTDLVKPSKIKSIVPFLTLENMVMEEEDLQKMFLSSGWKSLVCSSTREGQSIADLVADKTFWNGAFTVLKVTIPLVKVLKLINGSNKPEIGSIYDTIDQAKETIKLEFQSRKSQYIQFWEAIDEIWNKYLHSPLHAAGYFLNPSVQDLMMLQIDKYRMAKGDFGLGSAKLENIHPALWWSKYGEECPELQKMAVRILSQTCDGASKYNLKRTLAEALLTEGRNQIEQERLRDLAFVHYNLQLQNFKPDVRNDFSDEEIDPMDDWIVERRHGKSIRNDEPMLIDLDSEDSTREGVV
ncbi:PREDICTED: uncharacterized protein LOC109192332 isoform X2 [Ipomoea nil]|uniref:uncharacterized protein LOC109192332 isoform X2 n=1 Tax=Ipomoea nil TaxID=35883 RepID=UPI000901BBB3|nr:PREDICTED: uncharacterized protein LOC109192332 isoform X2 [Ipomoea nil]